jgi:hypothetical protein
MRDTIFFNPSILRYPTRTTQMAKCNADMDAMTKGNYTVPESESESSECSSDDEGEEDWKLPRGSDTKMLNTTTPTRKVMIPSRS